MARPTHKAAQDDEDQVERPIHDEWGVYDPEQAGFEAILKKLQATKKASVPDQARPKSTPAQPAADDDSGGIWMTPASVLKRDSK